MNFFRTKTVTRDKECHDMMIMGSVQQEDIIIKREASVVEYHKANINQYKWETYSNTIVVKDFTTILTSMDKSSRQKINEKNTGLKWHIRADGISRYTWNIPFQNITVHNFFRCTWDIECDRSHARPQNTP